MERKKQWEKHLQLPFPFCEVTFRPSTPGSTR